MVFFGFFYAGFFGCVFLDGFFWAGFLMPTLAVGDITLPYLRSLSFDLLWDQRYTGQVETPFKGTVSRDFQLFK